MLPRIISVPAFILVVASLNGCATTYVNENDANAKQKEGMDTVVYRSDKAFKTEPPICIAVLPLIDATDTDSDSIANTANVSRLTDKKLKALRRNLYSHLAPYPYRDVEIKQVDKVVAEFGNKPDSYAAIGKALNCDALLVGKVTSYRSDFLALYSQTAIGATLSLVRANTGQQLWQGRYRAQSHAGGVPITPIDFVVGLFSATENVSDEQVVRVEDDLFRRLLSTWDRPETGTDEAVVKFAAKQEKYNYYVTAAKLNLRSGPGTKYSAKEILNKNQKIMLVDLNHKPWVQVKLANGELGYVHSDYIARDKQDSLMLTDSH